MSNQQDLEQHRKTMQRLLKKFEDTKNFPNLEEFRDIAKLFQLFPSSAFWHPITTVLKHICGYMLSHGKLNSLQDITSCILLCQLIIDIEEENQRWIPEVSSCIITVILLLMGVNKIEKSQNLKIIADLKLLWPIELRLNEMPSNEYGLAIQSYNNLEMRKIPLNLLLMEEYLNEELIFQNDDIKASLLLHSTHLIMKLAKLLNSIPTFFIIFDPIKTLVLSMHSFLVQENASFFLIERFNDLAEILKV